MERIVTPKTNDEDENERQRCRNGFSHSLYYRWWTGFPEASTERLAGYAT